MSITVSDWCPAKEEIPTFHLRWKGGILEQAFEIRTYGQQIQSRIEWRPVPTEPDDTP